MLGRALLLANVAASPITVAPILAIGGEEEQGRWRCRPRLLVDLSGAMDGEEGSGGARL